MELKDYQQRVIDDIGRYLNKLETEQSAHEAYAQAWEERGFKVGPEGIKPYQHTIPGVPHVCAKVPTAGGKTFIAVCALEPILAMFRRFDPTQPNFVVWLVPSLTILDQTVSNLSNPEHPYRKKLSQLFRNRVAIYEKRDLLMGAGFSADTVSDQLSVVVMSFDSLRARNRDDRKIYQENGYLASFAANLAKVDGEALAEHDPSALINVIRSLHPLVVVDESHNAESQLSVEMLKNLNPWFILDLTATPRNNSNIISYVDAMALKKQHMVKLPVIVSNQADREQVIESALILRRHLEARAEAEEKKGGKYIRPIILFQAQAKTNDDNTTFEKIRDKLVLLRIPKEQIAIKTAGNNELKGVDLMSKTCPIRYIITVNALKEGWDCPFAYVLASLADKSSAVDVEQILGRVLRMPHVREHGDDLLNVSYVLTASSKFQDTLDKVVQGLNRAGFTARDHRIVDPPSLFATASGQALPFPPSLAALAGFAFDPAAPTTGVAEIDVARVSPTWDAQTTPTGQGGPPTAAAALVEAIKASAKTESAAFAAKAEQADPTVPADLEDKLNRQKIKDVFRDSAKALQLPQFVIKVKAGGWFDDDEVWQLYEEAELLKGFKLSTQDATIALDEIEPEMTGVDLEQVGEGDYRAAPMQLSAAKKKFLAENMLRGSPASQVRTVTDRLFDLVGNQYPIPDQEVRAWLRRIVEDMTVEQMRDCMERDFLYRAKIIEKLKGLKEVHAEKAFLAETDVDHIAVQPTFALPDSIAPNQLAAVVAKSLYMNEGAMGEFEHGVISQIASLDSVLWWHRNLSRGKGFWINGYLNHYPDFIVRMKSGRTVLIETKGDDRDNSDSEKKLKLGKVWEAKSGSQFKYMMVFNAKAIDGAERLQDALAKLRQL